MPQFLKEGAVLETLDGEPVVAGKQFAEGGQGWVFLCKFRDEEMVLKLWKKGTTTAEQRRQLVENCKKGSPCRSFAWPSAVVAGTSGEPIGYVMEMVGGQGCGTLQDRLFGTSSATYWAITSAMIETTQATMSLHGWGRYYGDLNTNNVIFHSLTGRSWLVDVDNVVTEGSDIGIAFSFGAASPSVVLGKSKPGIESDRYSLAATHFMFLTGGIPLEGCRAATPCAPSFEEMKRLHGTDPLFIFDEKDNSNRPDPALHAGVQENWEQLPKKIRAMFTQTFTAGLSDPHARYGESTWLDALIELKDSIVVCSGCGAHIFTEPADGKLCWNCKKPARPKRELVLPGMRVVLNKGKALYPHHLDRSRRSDLSVREASVVVHPQDKKVWGLKNLSPLTWSVITPGGEARSVPAGKVAPLARGNRLAFGSVEALVV